MSTSSPPAKPRWGRMGNMVRRTSSVLAATRPATPNTSPRLPRLLTPRASSSLPRSPANSPPSPVAESPAREIVAYPDHQPTGPSTLAQAATSSDATLNVEFADLPIMDSSTAAPGVFTEELDELSTVATGPPANCSSSPSLVAAQHFAAPSSIAESPAREVVSPESRALVGSSPLARELRQPWVTTSPPYRSLLSSAPQRFMAPSPIAESPVREAASLEDHAPVGPSTLTHELRRPAVATGDPGRPLLPSTTQYLTVLSPIVKSPAREAASSEDHALIGLSALASELPLPAVATSPPNRSSSPPTARHSMVSSPITESPVSEVEHARLREAVRTAFISSNVQVKAEPEAKHATRETERKVTYEIEHEAAYRATRVTERESVMADHAPISPSPPAQSTVVSDTISSTPASGYIPPDSNSFPGSGAFTDDPDELPQPTVILDPAHGPPSFFEWESAAHTTEHLPIPEPRTPPPPAPELPVAPQTVELSDRDSSDRSRASSTHMPDCDASADLIAPNLVQSHPDEPHLLGAENESPHEPVRGVPRDEDDDNIIIPSPDNGGDPGSVQDQEAASTRSIEGFDTDESIPLRLRPGSPENVVYRQPPAYHDYLTVSPSFISEGIPMDCGMIPSRLIYPPGQGPSRRRMASPSERGKASSGDDRTRFGWASPFAVDHHTINSHQDSGKSVDEVYYVSHEFEAYEASPHVSSPSPSSGYESQLQSSAKPHRVIPLSTRPPPPQDDQPFHGHGWVECLLPDESLYYVHQTYQVVTDLDLSNEKILDAVMAYLEEHSDVIPPGQELWLRDIGSHEGGFAPLRCLIDHSKQSVVLDSPHETNGDSEFQHTRGRGDDRLDAKYRYWSFMEAHPAHTSLPPDACQEAMDALSWASTDGLLPSHRSTPAPFTQEECQTLTSLLRSIEKRGETPLRTHMVSKILLRVVCWRQSHFRADEPVPVDRGGLRREDRSLLFRNSSVTLAAGVYACLATAIVVSPSKTFVRVAGIGAILFSLSPVASNVMAGTQSKVNHRSTVPHARRGMLMFPRKDHTVTDSQSLVSPPWHIRLWQGLESQLYRSKPSDVIPTTRS